MKTLAFIEMEDGHIFSINMKRYVSEYSEGVGMISTRDGQKTINFDENSEYDAMPAINYIKSVIKAHGKVIKEAWYEKEYGTFCFTTHCNFKTEE